MESDPTRLCELLVGLPAVNVLGVDDEGDEPSLCTSSRVRAGVTGVWLAGVGEGPATS